MKTITGALALLAVLGAGLGNPMPRPSDAAGNGPLTFSAALRSNSIVRGGPIILDYRVTSSDPRPARFSACAEDERFGQLAYCLRRADGTVLRKFTETKPSHPYGTSGASSASATTPLRASTVVSQYVMPPATGRYELVVRARLLYTSDWAEKEQRLESEVVIPFTIQPFSRRTLNKIGWDLVNRVVDQTQQKEGLLSLRALAYLPESVAQPMWAQIMADDTGRAPGDLGALLAARGTRACADFLIAAWDGAPSNLARCRAQTSLEEMYRKAPDRRPRIVAAFRARGLALPELPPANVIEWPP